MKDGDADAVLALREGQRVDFQREGRRPDNGDLHLVHDEHGVRDAVGRSADGERRGDDLVLFRQLKGDGAETEVPVAVTASSEETVFPLGGAAHRQADQAREQDPAQKPLNVRLHRTPHCRSTDCSANYRSYKRQAVRRQSNPNPRRYRICGAPVSARRSEK
ncbi:MAG: hypothetical protein ACYTDU_17685 [Planctomycetota bacterium]